MRVICISRSLQVTIGKLDRFLKFEWMFGLIFSLFNGISRVFRTLKDEIS